MAFLRYQKCLLTGPLTPSNNELCVVRGASLLSAPSPHIFVNFSANESFSQVFIDNHTKSKLFH